MKYGLQGYGLYWYCLELIAQNVDKHNLTFELEHDSEIIAYDTGINYELVQEMMLYMVKLGLFDEIDGKIYCLKMLKRMDQSMTSDPEMRRMLTAVKQNHDGVMTKSSDSHDVVMQEENRREEKRIDKKEIKRKRFTPPTEDEVRERCDEMGYTVCPARFWNYYESQGWKVGKNSMKDWHKALAGWQARDGDKAKGSTRDSDIRDDLTDTSWAH